MSINEEVPRVCATSIFEISSEVLTADQSIRATENDTELSKVKRELQLTSIDSEYTINNGILFKGERIVIPRSLQAEVLKELHSTHIGIEYLRPILDVNPF